MRQSPNDIVLVAGDNELFTQLTPVPMANLSGIITDSLDGSIIDGAKVTLDGLETYTDINGAYVFYGLNPGSYNGLAEHDAYKSTGFAATLVSGENAGDITLDPILLAAVIIGARTRATMPDLTEPSGSYKSRLTFNGGLLGDDYISNSSSYTNHTIDLPLNPASQQAWREIDLDKYEFGVWLWASAWTPAEYPDTRCTQLWVKALYEDGSSRILRPYSGTGWEKVDDVVPDEDASFISHTTSGGMIPWSGGFFNFKVK
ncbi:hypothetical protein ES708_10226 [subsurface metagenome]